jgi:hypothetical protein
MPAFVPAFFLRRKSKIPGCISVFWNIRYNSWYTHMDEWESPMTSRINFQLPLLLSLLLGSVAWSADSPKVTIDPRAKPTAPEAKGPRTDIRVDTTVVLINVTVTDPLNRFVTGLEKENFRLFEDKAEQKITHFASEDAPLSIGLVFDTSGSMGSKLTKSAKRFRIFSRPPILKTSSSWSSSTTARNWSRISPPTWKTSRIA